MPNQYGKERFLQTGNISYKNMQEIRKQTFEFHIRQFKAKMVKREKKAISAIYRITICYKINMEL